MVKKKSKKTPKTWRKNVDITDVEEFLEEKRLDERLGKTESGDSNELFIEDKKRDVSLYTTLAERREAKLRKPLRGFSALVNTSKVPEPIRVRNRVKLPEERRSAIIREEKRAKGIIPKKEILAQLNREKAKLRKEEIKKKRLDWKKDLWAIEEEKPIPDELKNEWIPEETVIHNMRNTRVLHVKAPKTIRSKPKKMVPIEPPHPGTSYNPTLKHHQELMEKVIDRETKIIKTENHLDRVTTTKFKFISEEERDSNMLKEMSEGVAPEYEIEIKEEKMDDDEELKLSVNPPVINKKKDRKARRKQHENRILKEELKKKKVEQKKIADLHKLKKLKEAAEEHTKQIEATILKTREKLKNKVYEPGRIGPVKYEEPEIDIALPEDMSGGLRTLKPQGKIICDRFNSFQKRCIVPTGKHAGIRKKAKVKKFTKKSHKEIEPNQPILKKQNKTLFKVEAK